MGSKKAAVSLSEIYKRVPSNQIKQFDILSKKYTKYLRRMNKFPNKLPEINWAEYKTRVRAESIPLLEEFEKKYEELNKIFDERDKLDRSRYYKDLEAEKSVVMADIAKFKEESECRIQEIEKELERYKNMKPYKDMTMEEFCILMPEKAQNVPFFGNNDLFWPFDLDEQLSGPQPEVPEQDVKPLEPPPKVDPPKIDPTEVDPPKGGQPKIDPSKVDQSKVDQAKVDPPKVDPSKIDPPKVDPPKTAATMSKRVAKAKARAKAKKKSIVTKVETAPETKVDTAAENSKTSIIIEKKPKVENKDEGQSVGDKKTDDKK